MEQYIPLALTAALIAVVWYLKRPNISSGDAHRLVADGAHLVDVRSPGEFASGHVEGARNIPVGEIGSRAGELKPTDRPVILYCASGARSAIAARALRSAGFTRVYNLGPMSNW